MYRERETDIDIDIDMFTWSVSGFRRASLLEMPIMSLQIELTFTTVDEHQTMCLVSARFAHDVLQASQSLHVWICGFLDLGSRL